jgi:phosphate acyltransferase
MRIALDAMGGDHAPQAPVQGALEALACLPVEDEIILVGRSEEIHALLSDAGVLSDRLHVVDAAEVIGMDEAPTVALSHKRKASIPIAYGLIRQGKADAFISAGNTGAMLVGAMYTLHTIPGIIRPCIPALVPQHNGKYSLILDVGSNPDAKPDVLYQYAIIGKAYSSLIMEVPEPRVALLNIGEEEEKGSLLTQATHRLMKESPDFRFTGNIEARDLFNDTADVIVCDGFTGNIVLKQAEAFYNLLLSRNITDPFFERYNYENYGGTPILGINGIAMIAHGISSSVAFRNMFLEVKKIHDSGLINELRESLKRFIT